MELLELIADYVKNDLGVINWFLGTNQTYSSDHKTYLRIVNPSIGRVIDINITHSKIVVDVRNSGNKSNYHIDPHSPDALLKLGSIIKNQT